MAYRVRFYMEMNAREAMHVIELRTAPQGHPAYRRVCQAMHRLIAEQAGHRALAAAMQFADHSEWSSSGSRPSERSPRSADPRDHGSRITRISRRGSRYGTRIARITSRRGYADYCEARITTGVPCSSVPGIDISRASRILPVADHADHTLDANPRILRDADYADYCEPRITTAGPCSSRP